MSKAKFDAAQELIDEKDYAGARAILKSIDDPTAREWERRIDALQPPRSSRKQYQLIAAIAFGIGGLALLVTIISFLDPQMDFSTRSVAGVLAIIGLVVAYVMNRLSKR